MFAFLQVTQLEELLAVRHSVFVVGGPGTGKSQVSSQQRLCPCSQCNSSDSSANHGLNTDIFPDSEKKNTKTGLMSFPSLDLKDSAQNLHKHEDETCLE